MAGSKFSAVDSITLGWCRIDTKNENMTANCPRAIVSSWFFWMDARRRLWKTNSDTFGWANPIACVTATSFNRSSQFPLNSQSCCLCYGIPNTLEDLPLPQEGRKTTTPCVTASYGSEFFLSPVILRLSHNEYRTFGPMSHLVGNTAVAAHGDQVRAEFVRTSHNLVCGIAFGSKLMMRNQSLMCERRIRRHENLFGFQLALDLEAVSFLRINPQSFEKRYHRFLDMEKIDLRSFRIDENAKLSGCLERPFRSIYSQQHSARSCPNRGSQFGGTVQRCHCGQRISRKQLQRRFSRCGQMANPLEWKTGTSNRARQAVAAHDGPLLVVR